MNPNVIEISWIAAFLAGIISFLSPCILPLIPGYLSLVTKLSFEELTDTEKTNKIKDILIPSIFFGLGFTSIFVSLGISASYIGQFLLENKSLLLHISGAAIILLGFFTMELIKIPFLYKEKKLDIKTNSFGLLGTFFLGCAFGFAWTPCVGPILATILLYASTTGGALKGGLLLLVYSLGLGIPFILTGLTFNKALTTFKFIRKHYLYYKYIVSFTLISVGLLMLFDKIFYLNIYGQKFLDIFGINFWQRF